jgi:hypothetical protein
VENVHSNGSPRRAKAATAVIPNGTTKKTPSHNKAGRIKNQVQRDRPIMKKTKIRR